VSCCDVLTRDLGITFEDLLCYIYFNVSAINYKCISLLFYISLLRNAIIKLLTRLSFYRLLLCVSYGLTTFAFNNLIIVLSCKF
jgi:hypothetical protein